MKKVEARAWAMQLNLAARRAPLLAQPYDLGLVLLGDDYLDALASTRRQARRSDDPVLRQGIVSATPGVGGLAPVVLANKDATRFACGMVGIKGELASRRTGATGDESRAGVRHCCGQYPVLNHLAGAVPIVKKGAQPLA